jgi:hypothetical protein
MNLLANWMKNSWVYDFLVMNNSWIWPAMEIVHFIGLAMLFGALLVMDLRLLGWNKLASIVDTSKLSVVAQVGFAINAVSGVLFCFGNPDRYFINPAFQFKIVLIALAGLNFLYYHNKIEPKLASIGPGEATPLNAKMAGAASLTLWFGVLMCGRLIPYLGEY